MQGDGTENQGYMKSEYMSIKKFPKRTLINFEDYRERINDRQVG